MKNEQNNKENKRMKEEKKGNRESFKKNKRRKNKIPFSKMEGNGKNKKNIKVYKIRHVQDIDLLFRTEVRSKSIAPLHHCPTTSSAWPVYKRAGGYECGG
jgi:hypothetical protein